MPTAEKDPGGHNAVQWTAFGLGHVLNDLAACGWFSFYLVYLTHVLLISDVQAGLLLFVGQVADAVATPLVGMLCDRCTLGRKFVLGVGCVLVGVSYPLMYEPIPSANASPSARFWGLATTIVVFQFGWAASQIAHLALLSDIGHTSRVRTLLNSIRFGATVSSNLVVFLAAFFLLSAGGQRVTPSDAPEFRSLAFLVSGFGLLCSIGCLSLVVVPHSPRTPSKMLGERATRTAWWQWFCRVDFWQAGMLYMCARLVTNTLQVYLQLYVVDTLHMPPVALAVVPSGFFAGQMAASLAVPAVTQRVSSETVLFGSLGGIVLGSFFAYLARVWYVGFVYAGSTLMGVGCGGAMVVSLAIVADLVSTQRQTAAWVYGLMSFSDKLSGGFALLLIQRGLDAFGTSGGAARGEYLLQVVTLLPLAICAVAFLTMTSHTHSKCGEPPAVTAEEEEVGLVRRGPSPRPDAVSELILTEARFGWAHWAAPLPTTPSDEEWDTWYVSVP